MDLFTHKPSQLPGEHTSLCSHSATGIIKHYIKMPSMSSQVPILHLGEVRRGEFRPCLRTLAAVQGACWTRTRDLTYSSPASYHWTTALPILILVAKIKSKMKYYLFCCIHETIVHYDVYCLYMFYIKSKTTSTQITHTDEHLIHTSYHITSPVSGVHHICTSPW